MEVNPPKGVDTTQVFSRLEGRLDGVDFLNVTDSALARMRCSPLPFAGLLKQRLGVEPLVNVSCRDRNAIALQADLLAGWMQGVRSVVALTGDAITVGDMPESKGVFEINSVGLLGIIQRLNSGLDMAGKPLQGNPEYRCGAVINLNARNPAAEIKRFKKKIDAGAEYALSQPVFDVDTALNFFSDPFFSAPEMKRIPIMVGLLAFKSKSSAVAMSSIPGIKVSESVASEIQNLKESDVSSWSIKRCLDLATSLQERVAGFHVISGAAPSLALDVLDQLVRTFR